MSDLHELFATGTVPKTLNGFHPGSLEKLYPKTFIEHLGRYIFPLWLPWYGKEFDSTAKRGINRVPAVLEPIARARYGNRAIGDKIGYAIRAFPFATKDTTALKDTTKVLQLSYDLPENPPTIRAIVDELVELDDKYLGKAYTKEGTDYRLLAMFSLEK